MLLLLFQLGKSAMMNKLKCGALSALLVVSIASPALSRPSPTPAAAQQDQGEADRSGPAAFGMIGGAASNLRSPALRGGSWRNNEAIRMY
jgi:hypothetical protein